MAIGLAAVAVLAVLWYLGYLRPIMGTVKLPWGGNGTVVTLRNVQFTNMPLRFGVNYTFYCNLHGSGPYYCMDTVLNKTAAKPGTAYKIVAYVKAPAEITISGRCWGIELRHTGYYIVIAKFYKSYDLYIVTYRNSTGTYHYTYRYECGKPICDKEGMCVESKPAPMFQVIFDVPRYRFDLKHNRIYVVNYTSAYAWAVVYKLR